jgi:integrase
MVGMHRLCCTGAVQRRDRNDIVAALRDGAKQEKCTAAVDIIGQLALTGYRRCEMIGLKWTEADTEVSYLRLEDSKEGEAIRLIGLPVVEYIERRRTDDVGTCVFPRQGEDNTLGSFPSHWKHLFEDSPLSDVTPHVLRHYVASRTMSRACGRLGNFGRNCGSPSIEAQPITRHSPGGYIVTPMSPAT